MNLIDYQNKTIYSIGLMSGTSLDGLDIAYCLHETKNNKTHHSLIHFQTYEYGSLKEKILRNTFVNSSKVSEICSLNKEIGLFYLESLKKFIKEFNINIDDISFISSHGQTMYHIPNDEENLKRSTFQIGDMTDISYYFNKLVVYDFRTLDIAAGGGGAPLVPRVNFELFIDEAPVMMLNVGGISNITYIKDQNIDHVIACDTGPGNMIIDQLMKKLFNKDFDDNGFIASNGKLNKELLDIMLDDDYYIKSYPKSTGREKYNDLFIDKLVKTINDNNILKEDAIYTSTYFTAYTINKFIEDFIQNKDYIIYISGGGSHNQTLINILRSFDLDVRLLDEKYNVDAIEAMSFSILGFLRLTNQLGNIKNVTGAKENVMLGSIILPPRIEE